ncbi:MAG: hypothetical protein KDD33_07895 [Bdellovibrionales bacterium]|nr:hypothetical protein [Bdellovibrionales bacterium]
MAKDKVDLNWDAEEVKKGGIVPETLKRLLATGVSSAFMSEEQIRQYLSPLNLPKEVLLQVVKGAQKSKDDVLNKAGAEFSKLVQKIDIVKEFKNILREHKISISAEVEFIPKEKPEEQKLDE